MPKHKTDYFQELQFNLIINNEEDHQRSRSQRYKAQCLVCMQILSNTAENRLKSHRNRCFHQNVGSGGTDQKKRKIQNKSRNDDSSSSGESDNSSIDSPSTSSEQTIIREGETADDGDPLLIATIDNNTTNIDAVPIIDANDGLLQVVVDESGQQVNVADVTIDSQTVSIATTSSPSANTSVMSNTETRSVNTSTDSRFFDIFTRKEMPSSRHSMPLNRRAASKSANRTLIDSRSIPDLHSSSPSSPASVSSLTSSPSSTNTSSSNVSLSALANQQMRQKSNLRKRGSLGSFIDSVTDQEIETINEKLARFFFGCNIPFSVVESDHFKELIRSLRPAYASHLPGRRTISGSLLKKEFDRCISSSRKFNEESAVLLIDGWKNTASNTKTIVGILHAVNRTQLFLDAWDLTTESENAEKLTEIVEECQQLAKETYNIQIFAVISDNAAAMVKMGKMIPLWHLTCNSHTGNLFAKDINDPDLNKKVMSILKEFRHPDFERQLVNLGGVRIIEPCETRWCTYRDSKKCLLRNIHIMRQIAAKDTNRKMKQSVKQLIFDDEFLEQVKKDIELQDPICELINTAQSRNATLAEICGKWIDLKLPEGDEYKKFEDKLEKRKKVALNQYALSAYTLDPKFCDEASEKLTMEQKLVVQEFFLGELNADGLSDLEEFQNKRGIFAKLFEKGVTDASTFWHNAKLHHPELSTLALKLNQIPPSTAQLERVFSNWSYVHSNLRNRLSFENSKKLIHIYYTLKISDSVKSDEF